LFEPFYRARSGVDDKPGWGLGLTFVKRIVDQHQGTIEARCGTDGISVSIWLPLAWQAKE